jgi:hypothetical protein
MHYKNAFQLEHQTFFFKSHSLGDALQVWYKFCTATFLSKLLPFRYSRLEYKIARTLQFDILGKTLCFVLHPSRLQVDVACMYLHGSRNPHTCTCIFLLIASWSSFATSSHASSHWFSIPSAEKHESGPSKAIEISYIMARICLRLLVATQSPVHSQTFHFSILCLAAMYSHFSCKVTVKTIHIHCLIKNVRLRLHNNVYWIFNCLYS